MKTIVEEYKNCLKKLKTTYDGNKVARNWIYMSNSCFRRLTIVAKSLFSFSDKSEKHVQQTVLYSYYKKTSLKELHVVKKFRSLSKRFFTPTFLALF